MAQFFINYSELSLIHKIFGSSVNKSSDAIHYVLFAR